MDFVNIEKSAEKLRSLFQDKGMIRVITHFDSDGISSAAIISQVLRKYDQQFCVSVVKQIENSLLDKIEKQVSKWKALIFLDLGSSNLTRIKQFAKHTTVFVIDHHKIESAFESAEKQELNDENFYLINSPEREEISASGLSYFFARQLTKDRKLAQIAVIGMVGDWLDKKITKANNLLFADAQKGEMQIKRGLTFFSATRPLHKALEFSSSIFIPGVTGCVEGALNMLKDIGIGLKKSRGWKTLTDLNDDELSRLITAVLVRRVNDGQNQDIIANVYLIKITNRLWDAREISTMLNACGRLGYPGLAISFLMGSNDAKDEIERVYNKYKHHLIKSLNYAENAKKIEGDKFIIINARANIKDTMIGTVTSILSLSYLYKPGTVLIGLAYRPDGKIKVSARLVREKDDERGTDLYQILNSAVRVTGGECGGHTNAAGCLIERAKEGDFIELLEKNLSAQEIKIR